MALSTREPDCVGADWSHSDLSAVQASAPSSQRDEREAKPNLTTFNIALLQCSDFSAFKRNVGLAVSLGPGLLEPVGPY